MMKDDTSKKTEIRHRFERIVTCAWCGNRYAGAVVDAACRAHGSGMVSSSVLIDASHLPPSMIGSSHGSECQICAAVDAYRRFQRWNGEIDDGEAKTLTEREGRQAYVRHLREAMRRMEDLVAFVERDRQDDGDHDADVEGGAGASSGGEDLPP